MTEIANLLSGHKILFNDYLYKVYDKQCSADKNRLVDPIVRLRDSINQYVDESDWEEETCLTLHTEMFG